MADRLIPDAARNGRILDVGCGTSPLFLLSTRFREKHGLDKSAGAETNVLSGEESLLIRRFDIENESALPYKDGFFDVVTMLAVFEHIEPERLAGVMGEARRVLKNNGLLILTTPAAWTDGLLRALARVVKLSLKPRQPIHKLVSLGLHLVEFRPRNRLFGFRHYFGIGRLLICLLLRRRFLNRILLGNHVIRPSGDLGLH